MIEETRSRLRSLTITLHNEARKSWRKGEEEAREVEDIGLVRSDIGTLQDGQNNLSRSNPTSLGVQAT